MTKQKSVAVYNGLQTSKQEIFNQINPDKLIFLNGFIYISIHFFLLNQFMHFKLLKKIDLKISVIFLRIIYNLLKN